MPCPTSRRKRPVTSPAGDGIERDRRPARRQLVEGREDGVYLVRNNRWYRDDGLEAPQPLLRRWFGLLLQARRQAAAQAEKLQAAAPSVPQPFPQAAPPVTPQSPEERTATMKQTWDWAAEVFGALTPWQVYNGLALFQPEERDLADPKRRLGKARQGAEGLSPRPASGRAALGSSRLTLRSRRSAARSPPSKGCRIRCSCTPSLDDARRTALLEGRLPASALSPSQLAQAVSLQPLLPQALQNLPAASVFLGLLPRWGNSHRVTFGDFPSMGLEVATPPTPAPPSVP